MLRSAICASGCRSCERRRRRCLVGPPSGLVPTLGGCGCGRCVDPDYRAERQHENQTFAIDTLHDGDCNYRADRGLVVVSHRAICHSSFKSITTCHITERAQATGLEVHCVGFGNQHSDRGTVLAVHCRNLGPGILRKRTHSVTPLRRQSFI